MKHTVLPSGKNSACALGARGRVMAMVRSQSAYAISAAVAAAGVGVVGVVVGVVVVG